MTRSKATTRKLMQTRSGAALTAREPPAVQTEPEALARELSENLAGLQSLLRQLLELAGQKLSAIRAANADEVQGCTACEADRLEQVHRLEQQRTAILARWAQGVPATGHKRLCLSEVADTFPEPFSSALRARNAALRQIAVELQEKNRLVANVARHLQSHIEAIFSDLARANQESVVYGPKGRHEQRNVRSWVDAVG